MSSRILSIDGKPGPRFIPALPEVTIIAATSVAIPQTVRAMTISLQQANFAAALMFSDQPPILGRLDDIEWHRVKPIRSRHDYSRFILQGLRDYVATSHVLCVQWDGYVLDGTAWDRDFLNYDYIGAPWPHFTDGHNVGNGGFSLRSRRLLDACHALGIDDMPEDVAICRIHRAALEHDFSIRFAPEALARRFAFERYPPVGREFGFHGAFNMVRLVDVETFGSLLSELEPGLLNRREHRELLWAALRRGRLRTAQTLIRRLREGARRH